MRRGRREEGMGGERRGKGEREGRKGTEEGPTKNSCRGGGPECEVTPLHGAVSYFYILP